MLHQSIARSFVGWQACNRALCLLYRLGARCQPLVQAVNALAARRDEHPAARLLTLLCLELLAVLVKEALAGSL